MTYSQVKQAWLTDSFDLVMATQQQIDKLEQEFIKTDNEHGIDYLQARYSDFKEELASIN
tara:strand:+ start:378 stop:557 length:180 start_codon:yes stop_codon:yes gene_type:complete